MNGFILAAWCAASSWILAADSLAAEVTFAVVTIAAATRIVWLARRNGARNSP